MLRAVLFVTLVTVLAGDDGSIWSQFASKIPDSWRSKVESCVQGFGVACTYVMSAKGKEIENVINKLFEIIQNQAKGKSDIPSKDRKLRFHLGYVCWNDGTAVGLETIETIGKPEVTTMGSRTEITVYFHFKELRLKYDKCGYENGPVSIQGKCLVDLGEHKFKVAFLVENMQNFMKLIFGIWEKNCIFKLTDLQFTSLKDLGLQILDPDGSNRMTKDIIAFVINYMKDIVKYLVTRKVRVLLYTNLKSGFSYVCKDEDLESMVELKYPSYIKNPRPSSPEQFLKLCGKAKEIELLEDETRI